MTIGDARLFRVIAVSGSLRAASKNRALLEAAQLLAPNGVEIVLDWSLATLPHYNPDLDTLDGASLPVAAAEWRETIARANGLLISSPEYAHGFPASSRTHSIGW